MKILGIALTILGRALTIVAGAVPATYLCFFAYLVLMVGFMTLASGDLVGLVLVLWALAGFHGTISLWAVGFGVVRRWSVAGLLLGTLALLPFGGPYLAGARSTGLDGNPDGMMFVSPILVALAWLCTLASRSFRRPAVNEAEPSAG